jgi:hypothetical protein
MKERGRAEQEQKLCGGERASEARERKRKGARMANAKCESKNPPRLPHWVYSPTGCALRSTRPARINCR